MHRANPRRIGRRVAVASIGIGTGRMNFGLRTAPIKDSWQSLLQTIIHGDKLSSDQSGKKNNPWESLGSNTA